GFPAIRFPQCPDLIFRRVALALHVWVLLFMTQTNISPGSEKRSHVRASKVASLIDNCHEFRTFGSLMRDEKYFNKDQIYRGFNLHIHRFLTEGNNVIEADIQFRRCSKFPAPYINRNRFLIRKLKSVLDRMYSGEKTQDVNDEHRRQIHYKAFTQHFPSTPFEEWGSECALYDEPYSSGQTSKDLTGIRNDFVIIRFKRQTV
ncbi:MAG: hypothetical protein Q7J98_01930, partial [Kiritimatiellia bacterium]|nr:hypothetical protein [Kiritimatiellia bacterium]